MGNRHGNKQLQRAARSRMASTGESYQQALASLLAGREPARLTRLGSQITDIGTDLLPIDYFGLQLALATFEVAGRLSVLVLSGPRGRGPFPLNPLLALGTSRVVH